MSGQVATKSFGFGFKGGGYCSVNRASSSGSSRKGNAAEFESTCFGRARDWSCSELVSKGADSDTCARVTMASRGNPVRAEVA